MANDEVQRQVRAVLEELKGLLREQDHRSAMESNEAGEWGISFEAICAQLYEYEIRVPRDVYIKLQAIGAAMNIPPKTWLILESLVD